MLFSVKWAFDTLLPGAGALYMGYGNRVISEADAAGAVKREYIWLGDLIVGVVDGTALYSVENDHLGRPIRMRDAARADVRRAKYRPFGQALITGPATLDARFPGQWFQFETGLAWNWHRTYDQSLGRYLQPDPLGLSDGPSVYGYVHQSPLMGVDPEGRFWWLIPPAVGIVLGFGADYLENQNCSCDDNGYDLTLENGLGGAIRGTFGPYKLKPRMGIAGGGRSGTWTSVWSTLGGSSLRGIGRGAAKLSGVVSIGLVIYDGYRIYNCLNN